MAKKKIAAGKKIKEIKKPFQKIEIKLKEEKKEAKQASEQRGHNGEEPVDEEEEDGLEEGEEQKFDFDDFSSVERAAPVLRPTSGKDRGEALEGMLEGLGKKESREDDSAKRSEKPKYSFSASSSEDDEAIQELRHIVLKETPRLIERTHEARELNSSRIQDSMFGNLGVEEYAVKYVPQHKEEFLHEHEEIKDRKIDIKKYRKER